jgi:hypothetical protein
MTHMQLGNKHASQPPERQARSPWLSLLPAVAVSLVLHAVLLLVLVLPRAAQAPRTALVVTLRSAPEERPPAPPPAPAAPIKVPAPPPVAARPPEPAPPPSPAPAPATARQLAAARPDTASDPAPELARGPLPEGNPDLGELALQLLGRRLRVSVWVDPLGTVQKAEVAPNELTQQQVELLERAIAQVQFTPARGQHGAAAAGVLRTLLCFDEAGQLDASSDECWKPQPPQGR